MSQASDDGGSKSQDDFKAENAEEVRRVRLEYGSVIDEQLNVPDNVRPNEVLQQAEELFENVARTQEAVLDSTVVSLAACRGRQLATALPVSLRKFDSEEFAARVRDFVSDASQTGPLTEKAWAELGKLAEETAKTSHPFWYLYGSPGDVPAKAKKAPVRRTTQDAPDRAPTVPNKVSSVEQTIQETTTERVSVIHRLLGDLYKQTGCPVPYFEFVLHPQSFAKTCENIFHLSFLVNEGHARIKYDADNMVVVEPVFANMSTEREDRSGTFMMTMDMTKWQKAVKALNITEPVIPD
nr:non-structural maintenance of chromosomes element 4 homolog A-like [Dermacentor andersoni]